MTLSYYYYTRIKLEFAINSENFISDDRGKNVIPVLEFRTFRKSGNLTEKITMLRTNSGTGPDLGERAERATAHKKILNFFS